MHKKALQQHCGGRPSSLATPILQRGLSTFPPQQKGRRLNRQRQTSLVATAFAGAVPAVTAGAGLTVSTGIVPFFSFIVGSLGVAVLLVEQQVKRPQADKECSTCEGTGFVPCVCTRWSDGDRGCGICGSSGRMTCPSCGGGGTAVPIAARLQVQRLPSERQ